MNLHVCIPALFWPGNSHAEVCRHLELPALETILAKSLCAKEPGYAAESWLCEVFNVHKQCDWPVAPIMLQLDGRHIEFGDGYWLRVDPVHFRIENNHILLGDNHILNISLKEAISFTDSINKLISDDGLTLLPLYPDRWYLQCSKALELQTFLLSEVVGKNINNLLPCGNDSSIWNSRVNEIQMLLHEHPLNQAREARGDLVVNSVWAWGGGITPQQVHTSYSRIWSNHILARALAEMGKVVCHDLPEDVDELLQYPDDSGEWLVFLDNLRKYAGYKDVFNWRNELIKMEQSWFSPLLLALKRKQITQLKLTVISEHSSRSFTLTSGSLWKFWTTVRPLGSYS
ncbi:hypothetical protein ABO04_03080 [Nitrosomonas sp. HPC101]|uniref:hypothetical protein n=1 Tax=Nitrosomonas sp. HPC101 TaxID=1658667 RepID=UPI00136D55A1|nr:hypothetical protein [Nitrosomonas sp. HPC101]MXS84925.1 hypothetical protein [Nitrosomonas sp. HPC101]